MSLLFYGAAGCISKDSDAGTFDLWFKCGSRFFFFVLFSFPLRVSVMSRSTLGTKSTTSVM